MSTYVIFWQDKINLVAIEVSSCINNARIVKKVTDEVNEEKAQIFEYDEFIIYLKKIISFHKDREKNMAMYDILYYLDVFHPTIEAIENADIDKYYKKIMFAITPKKNKISAYPCIEVK